MSILSKIVLWFSCLGRALVVSLKLYFTFENDLERLRRIDAELTKIENDLEAL